MQDGAWHALALPTMLPVQGHIKPSQLGSSGWACGPSATSQSPSSVSGGLWGGFRTVLTEGDAEVRGEEPELWSQRDLVSVSSCHLLLCRPQQATTLSDQTTRMETEGVCKHLAHGTQ